MPAILTNYSNYYDTILVRYQVEGSTEFHPYYQKSLELLSTFFKSLPTVPLGDWQKKKKVPAIIIKQQFGFPMSTT